MAAVPMTESQVKTLGIPATNSRPRRWDRGEVRPASFRPRSSIFTINATTPYTTAVMPTATTAKMTPRDTTGSVMTSLSAITMISAERMKSVRIAPAIVDDSASGPSCAAGTS